MRLTITREQHTFLALLFDRGFQSLVVVCSVHQEVENPYGNRTLYPIKSDVMYTVVVQPIPKNYRIQKENFMQLHRQMPKMNIPKKLRNDSLVRLPKGMRINTISKTS